MQEQMCSVTDCLALCDGRAFLERGSLALEASAAGFDTFLVRISSCTSSAEVPQGRCQHVQKFICSDRLTKLTLLL